MIIIRKIVFTICCILLSQAMLLAQGYKIVVLPFDKLNKEKNTELETLSVGISETLSGALSTVDSFIIIDSDRVKRHLLDSAGFKQAIGVNEEKDLEKLIQKLENSVDKE